MDFKVHKASATNGSPTFIWAKDGNKWSGIQADGGEAGRGDLPGKADGALESGIEGGGATAGAGGAGLILESDFVSGGFQPENGFGAGGAGGSATMCAAAGGNGLILLSLYRLPDEYTAAIIN